VKKIGLFWRGVGILGSICVLGICSIVYGGACDGLCDISCGLTKYWYVSATMGWGREYTVEVWPGEAVGCNSIRTLTLSSGTNVQLVNYVIWDEFSSFCTTTVWSDGDVSLCSLVQGNGDNLVYIQCTAEFGG